jgi:hypothetical protein
MNVTNIEHMASPVKQKLLELLDDVLRHDGFGDIRVEVRILKRKQKEVILHCGKQYRFVVDTPATETTKQMTTA